MALSYENKILRKTRLVGIGLVIVGFLLLLLSLSADPGLLEYHSYEFEVGTRPIDGVQLQDFQIEYDFVNQKGKIHFFLTRTNYTEYLVFRLPEEVEVTNFNWTDRGYDDDQNFSIFQEDKDYEFETKLNPHKPIHLIVSVDNLNKSRKAYWSEIFLNFEGKIYPNAEFRFTPDTETIKPPTGIENGAFFKFNLEDKYSCSQPCYESFRKEELEFHYRDNKLTVATKKEPQSWKDVGYHIFNLNYNKKNNAFLKNLRAIGVFFLSLGAIPAFEFFLLRHYKRKRKKKKAERN